MTPAPIRSAGNAKPWQTRPSADRLGNAPHVYGRLQPLETPRRSFWQRVFGKEG